MLYTLQETISGSFVSFDVCEKKKCFDAYISLGNRVLTVSLENTTDLFGRMELIPGTITVVTYNGKVT